MTAAGATTPGSLPLNVKVDEAQIDCLENQQRDVAGIRITNMSMIGIYALASTLLVGIAAAVAAGPPVSKVTE